VSDQAVNPGPNNVNSQLLRLEYRDVAGAWHALATKVDLASNCSGRGASVRIEPIGILPPATDLRGVVDAAFSDIVGETNLLPQTAFAPARTQVAPTPLADDVLEEFANTANEDATTNFVEPRALWANDQLTASSGFTGTGGPGGDFDWEVPAGQILVFDTQFTIIVGGPGFNPVNQQACVGGIVQVRNLRIAAGATLKVQGANPLVILAGGKVQILGVLEQALALNLQAFRRQWSWNRHLSPDLLAFLGSCQPRNRMQLHFAFAIRIHQFCLRIEVGHLKAMLRRKLSV